MNLLPKSNDCLIIIDAQDWILDLPLEPISRRQLTSAIFSRVEKSRGAGQKLIWIQYLRLDKSDGGKFGKGRLDIDCGYLRTDTVVEKYGIDAFQQTTLNLRLKQLNIERIILAGLVTSHAIKETAISAAKLGYSVQVDSQCCAALSTHEHQHAINQMQKNQDIEILG